MMPHDASPLLLTVCRHALPQVISRAHRLPAGAVALTAWSYAHLRHTHAPMFQALGRRAAALAAGGRLGARDARQLLHAAAKLGVRDQVLLRTCVKVSVRRWRGGPGG
jgi:hypothetical protein